MDNSVGETTREDECENGPGHDWETGEHGVCAHCGTVCTHADRDPLMDGFDPAKESTTTAHCNLCSETVMINGDANGSWWEVI